MKNKKRYYWLKLPKDFFTSLKIKKLRKIAGGDTYTIIYLKLCLLSISNNGIIYYEGIEETFEKEIALLLDEDEDNVVFTLMFMKGQGLIIEQKDNIADLDILNSYFLPEASLMIGSESESAARVRKLRNKQINSLKNTENSKALQCNADVTNLYKNVTSSENQTEINENHIISNEISKLITNNPKTLHCNANVTLEKDIDIRIKEIKEKEEVKEEKEKLLLLPSRSEIISYCQKKNKWIDVDQFLEWYSNPEHKIPADGKLQWEQKVDRWYLRNKAEGKDYSFLADTYLTEKPARYHQKSENIENISDEEFKSILEQIQQHIL